MRLLPILLACACLLAPVSHAGSGPEPTLTALLRVTEPVAGGVLRQRLAARLEQQSLERVIDELVTGLRANPLQVERLRVLERGMHGLAAYAVLVALGEVGVAIEPARLNRILENAARDGSAEAAFQLSLRLQRDDAAASLRWLRSALEQDHAGARRELAFRYRVGDGVERNPAKTLRLLRALHREGYVPAFADLAELYLQGGPGFPADAGRARELYAQAMAEGDDWAAFRLYQLLLKEDGAGRDEAGRALRQAANGGLIPALIALARWHLVGYLVEHAPDQALTLLDGAERRVLEAGFDIAGRGYYLRRIHLAQAEAALQRGDFAGARERLGRLLAVLQTAQAAPLAQRMRDYAALVEFSLELGDRPLASRALAELLTLAAADDAVYRDARLGFALQQVILLQGLQRADAARSLLARVGRELDASGGRVMQAALRAYQTALSEQQAGRLDAARVLFDDALRRFGEIGDVPVMLERHARMQIALSLLQGGDAEAAGRVLDTGLELDRAAARAGRWPWGLQAALDFTRALRAAGHPLQAEAWSRKAMAAFRLRAGQQHAAGLALLPGERTLLSELFILRGELLQQSPAAAAGRADDDTLAQWFADLALGGALSESAVIAGWERAADSDAGRARLLDLRLRSVRQFLLADQMPAALRPEGLIASAQDELAASSAARQAASIALPLLPGLLETSELLSEGEALLQFLVGERHGIALLLQRDGARLYPLRWSGEHPDRLVAELAASLRPGRDFADGAAEQLHHDLIQPLQQGLEGVGKLLVVPDARLADIPWSVLRDGAQPDAPWLLQRYAVSLLPNSLSLVRMLRSRSANTGFIGVGDVDLQPDGGLEAPRLTAVLDWRGRVQVTALAELAPIPGSRRLLVRNAALFGDASQLLLGVNASERGLYLADWGRAGILQLSLPVVAGGVPAGYLQPGLALSRPDLTGEHEDGYLSLAEIGASRIAARLVIVDGADTLATAGSGASVLALARGFARAGAHAVLASHQPLGAVAAEDFVQRLLQHYRGEHAASAALALRMTSLEMLYQAESAAERHPRYWAAASVIGP